MNTRDIEIPASVQDYLRLTLEEDRTGGDLTTEAWEAVCNETDDTVDWSLVCQRWAGERASTDNRIEMKNLYDIVAEELADMDDEDEED